MVKGHGGFPCVTVMGQHRGRECSLVETVWSDDENLTLNHQQGGGPGQEQELDEGGKSEEEESFDVGWRGEGRLDM